MTTTTTPTTGAAGTPGGTGATGRSNTAALRAPRLLAHQLRFDQKAFWRNPQSAIFTIGLPVILLLLAGLNQSDKIKDLGGIAYDQYQIPAVMTYALMSACFVNLAIKLINQRQSGILKRMHGTPLPAWGLFGGLAASYTVTTAVMVGITVGVGTIFYHVHVYHALALALACVVGVVTFCAIAVAVSSYITNADGAPAIVNLPFLALAFISGTFYPVDPTSTIAKVASYFPLYHLTRATFAPFDPLRAHASGFAWHDLSVLAVWAVCATVFAVRHFRWEPQRS